MTNDTGGQPKGLTPEQNLIGCMLLDPNPTTALAVARVVPVEAIQGDMERAIFAAAVDLAREDRWDPAAVSARVHRNGYPRDKHGSVTAEVSRVLAVAWPDRWQAYAYEVYDLYTRSRVASMLGSIEKGLRTQALTELAQGIQDAAEIAWRSGALCDALAGSAGS